MPCYFWFLSPSLCPYVFPHPGFLVLMCLYAPFYAYVVPISTRSVYPGAHRWSVAFCFCPRAFYVWLLFVFWAMYAQTRNQTPFDNNTCQKMCLCRQIRAVQVYGVYKWPNVFQFLTCSALFSLISGYLVSSPLLRYWHNLAFFLSDWLPRSSCWRCRCRGTALQPLFRWVYITPMPMSMACQRKCECISSYVVRSRHQFHAYFWETKGAKIAVCIWASHRSLCMAHLPRTLTHTKKTAGGKIQMPSPIYDGGVEYEDGTEANASQMSKDVSTFLAWASEPEQVSLHANTYTYCPLSGPGNAHPHVYMWIW